MTDTGREMLAEARAELARFSSSKRAELWTDKPAQKQVLSNVISVVTRYGHDVSRDQRALIRAAMEGLPLHKLPDVVLRELRIDPYADVTPKEVVNVDTHSYELAEHFLSDYPYAGETSKQRLAEAIQEAVEDWLAQNGFEP